MRLTIQNTLKGGIVTELESALAVVATEAGFVIDSVVSSELVHQIDGLLAGHTLLGSPCKGHDDDDGYDL